MMLFILGLCTSLTREKKLFDRDVRARSGMIVSWTLWIGTWTIWVFHQLLSLQTSWHS